MTVLDNIRREQATIQAHAEERHAQVEGAENYLHAAATDFLHWPWPELDEQVGGMAPGTLHYVISPSKGGKTTLLLSAVQRWIADGRYVVYGGFEMTAEVLRTMIAAQRCGIDPGDVLTGAWLGFTNYAALRERMGTEYRAQLTDPELTRLHFTAFASVGKRELNQMVEEAADRRAVVVIDHVDHINAGGKNPYDISMAANHLLLEKAKALGLTVIIASQLNTGNVQDPHRNHRPLPIERVKMGNHKLEVATTMLGWYRPLRSGLTKEALAKVRDGEADTSSILEPGQSAFNVMGHRFYGSRIGNRGRLRWDAGRILSLTPEQRRSLESARHGIPTAPRDFGEP